MTNAPDTCGSTASAWCRPCLATTRNHPNRHVDSHKPHGHEGELKMERIPTRLVELLYRLSHHHGALDIVLLLPYESYRSSDQYARRLQALLKRHGARLIAWGPIGNGTVRFVFRLGPRVSSDIFKDVLQSHPAIRQVEVQLSLVWPARKSPRRAVISGRKATRSLRSKDATSSPGA
jgi:hypothetical protein